MHQCVEFNGRKICFPLYIEVERRWPPIPPEERFDLDDLIVQDPSWWRTAVAVDTIDRMAREVGGDFGVQLEQVAAVGLASLQAQLPEGVSLTFSTRAATTA